MDARCWAAPVSHSSSLPHSPAITGIVRSCSSTSTLHLPPRQKKAVDLSPNRRCILPICSAGSRKPRLPISSARPAAAPTRIRAVVGEPAADFSSAPVEITWQIAVGAVAGITPFLVAGIEFSKRIVAQRRCEVCKGSGLVLKDTYYVRCPGCGGFLPWQSWKRFFTG
uniref:Viral late gene transcription factor 3 zinc ribbon domain-containing protein n=1 Tax=Ananas comosus var. bracteatus TaxID=296719 RepID=A0A6V7PSB3_ANACO|nr:unnamed protein product [Ananas comosus var. bracteatus]